MKTRRLISTIGYNSEGFLVEVLDRLVRSGVVDWAHYIRHKAEEDESKDHWHIVLMPSKIVDTRALEQEFNEVDFTHPDKPLGVQPCRISKTLDDWLLYAIHDQSYLSSKGQTRKWHYAREDVRSTCPDLLREQWAEVNLSKYGLGQILAEAVERRLPWQAVVASGVIPPAQWTWWREVYFSLRDGAVARPLRQELTHTPKESSKAAEGAIEGKQKASRARPPCWSDGTPLDEVDLKLMQEAWANEQ